ncbi:hypothetical protein L2E82_17554 [Cichorium intybus]|uniref:Uncharacterized protein n=1 Tax=Cichorium intybus TaxID=13427 RepID=A0ACB9F7V8_CICIN|nr:hypothetical protein L2E82_17554 [Cichorium intybus]
MKPLGRYVDKVTNLSSILYKVPRDMGCTYQEIIKLRRSPPCRHMRPDPDIDVRFLSKQLACLRVDGQADDGHDVPYGFPRT